MLSPCHNHSRSGIQKTRWCICPAMQQLKQHKSTLPKFFRFEVLTFMCEEGIKTSDNPKLYYRHILCSSNLQVIHPLSHKSLYFVLIFAYFYPTLTLEISFSHNLFYELCSICPVNFSFFPNLCDCAQTVILDFVFNEAPSCLC